MSPDFRDGQGVPDHPGADHGVVDGVVDGGVQPHFHDTDCSEFMLRIYEYMDGEMGPEENLRFEAHVRHCTPCLQQHRVDQTVKGLIRRVESATAAPATLRASIIARITTIRIETSD
ncbi:MAG TPA: mycothiol system anti-sigma-R factor [Intrasporangiaceae bacterium]|nr:mycothiol system anti-sigma-R factor [Intrasporangiaceae bacterium]